MEYLPTTLSRSLVAKIWSAIAWRSAPWSPARLIGSSTSEIAS